MSRAAALLACAALALTGCSAATSSPAATGSGKSCDYASAGTAARDVGTPPTNAEDKRATVTLTTNQGAVGIELATDIAPCTTRSFAYLASKKYFDGTPCHRLTAATSLKVLQCGDPTGRGNGGPGYTVPDENPTHLQQAGNAVIYPRGTVAMANTGQPNSGGSQFFLVYADSMLPPSYAVFGTIDDAGLAVLDKVAGAGVSGQRGSTDGAPLVAVSIEQASVGG